jgi:myosin heavy subunit
MSQSSTMVQMNEMYQKLEAYEMPTNLIGSLDQNADDDNGTMNDTDHSTTTTNHVVMMDEYERVRDIYLQRKLIHGVIDHVTTTATTMTMMKDTALRRPLPNPDVLQHIINEAVPLHPTKQEQQDVQVQQQQVLRTIQEKASFVQQKRYELQQKYKHLQQRREEFQAVLLMQQQQHKSSSSALDEDGEDENNNTCEDDDPTDSSFGTTEYTQEMMQQERKLQQLQEQRAQLQVQLQTVQQEYKAVTQNVDDTKRQFQTIVEQQQLRQSSHTTNVNTTSVLSEFINASKDWCESSPDEKSLLQLKEENNTLRDKQTKLKEIQDFYSNLRLLLEEFYGIRFVRTTIQNNAEPNWITWTVQFLKKYTVDITLHLTMSNHHHHRSNGADTAHSCDIKSAILTSDKKIVTGPPISITDEDNRENRHDGYNNSTTPKQQHSRTTMYVQLPIPKFDDIVQLVATTVNNTYAPGENVRVLLREIRTRITMIEERVIAFTELQNEPGVVATIGPFFTNSGGGGNDSGTGNGSTSPTTASTMIHDQEVVCSLNYPPMTMVLRCTGNCPLVDGSIYIDELHGLGGWDVQSVHDIQQRIANQKHYPYRTPMQLIHAVRKEVQDLVDTQQLIVPCTPRIPIRVYTTTQQQQALTDDNNNDSCTTTSNTKAFF